MKYIEIKIYTSSKGLDEVCNILHKNNASGFIIEDEDDFKDFLENNKQYWDFVDEELLKEKHKETCVKLYLDEEIASSQITAIEEDLKILKSKDLENEFGRLEIAQLLVDEEDWASNWKQYYKPFLVGEKLIICPLWEDYNKKDGEIVLKLDPGMAFGTGTHESTKLCLEMAQEYIKSGDEILDLGCGSGILSIGGLLLGAKKATAIDIDCLAVKVALENAMLNGINEERYKTFEGNITQNKELQEQIGFEKYDIVFANIVADVIIALACIIKKQLKIGGVLITSGIIDTRKDDVLKALKEQNFEIIQQKDDRGWMCFAAKK